MNPAGIMAETKPLSPEDSRNWLRAFVEHLHRTGALSNDDLSRLTRFHSVIDRRIGQLAVLKGFLGLKDVYQILADQTVQQVPFGQAAVKAGRLTNDQVQELLLLQKNTFLLFLESLTQTGVMTVDRLNDVVRGFRESLSSTRPAPEEAPPPPAAKKPARKLSQDDVRAKLRKVKGLFAMPTVLQRVLDMTQDPQCEVERLADIVSSDPILSTQLLRMVNSAAAGLPRRISRLTEAISRAGITAVRNLSLATLVVARFEGDDRERLTEIWLHSVLTSRWAQVLAAGQARGAVEEAFISGLIHDVARPVLLKSFPDQMQAVHDLVAQGTPLVEAERAYFSESHAEIGAFLCECWTFPVPLVQAVAYHHASLPILRDLGEGARLARIVHAACRLGGLPLQSENLVANGALIATLDGEFRAFHDIDDRLLPHVPDVCEKARDLAAWL